MGITKPHVRWWTRWAEGDDEVRRYIIQFAITKLKGGNGSDKISDDAVLAALSTRHLLLFEPDRRAPGVTTEVYEEGLAREYRQVALHMRTVHSIPEHREHLRTSTPSEPILAEAAGQLLLIWGGSQVEFLANSLHPLIGKGEPGELTGR